MTARCLLRGEFVDKGIILTFVFKDPQLSGKLSPKTVVTALGVVEFAEIGEGPVVVAIHGAMGGYDQSLVLAQTIGNSDFRYIAISRPGYLGTPMGSGGTTEQQGDLVAALLDALGITKAGVIAVSGGGPCAVQFGLRIGTGAWDSSWYQPSPVLSTRLSRFRSG
jgi:pimeloyl-ACP methyl ester carboxylesterase